MAVMVISHEGRLLTELPNIESAASAYGISTYKVREILKTGRPFGKDRLFFDIKIEEPGEGKEIDFV